MSTTTDRTALLSALEQEARRLEETPELRRAWMDRFVGLAHSVLDGLPQRKAWTSEGGARAALLDLDVPECPAEVASVLALVRDEVDGPGLQPASGGHLGYIPGGGIFPGALGDLLAAVTNRYAGVRYAGPGAVAVENLVLRWLRRELGLPEGAHGTLTSGGSIATLVAFCAARDARQLRARDYERAVVYVTRQAHHCIKKALVIAGLGDTVQRVIPVDHRFRMQPAALRSQIDADRCAGLSPFLLVATAGTTDTGAIDPLLELGHIAQAEGLWYHVDGAYGGAFKLVPVLRPRLAGLELADSVVVDPHKGLFLPYGTGAVLVRDPRHLAPSNNHRGAYLQDVTDLEDEPSPADLSPELTRHFRGLRMWLPLVLHGAARFRAALHEKHLLACHFHAEVRSLGFEVGPEPELSVALFRWVPRDGTDADACNRRILAEVLADGRIFLSSTTVDGVFWLRVAILCFRTHREHVDHLLGVLQRATAAR